MKPFEEATWELSPQKREALIRECMKVYNESYDEAAKHCDSAFTDRVYINDKYQVAVREFENPQFGGEWVHLSIKRIDKEVIHDWRDLQEIKNMMVGPENEGIELYPAESRRVDSANQFHIFVLKTEGAKFPIGYNERLVMNETNPETGAKQRSFDGSLAAKSLKQKTIDRIIQQQVNEMMKKRGD